MGQVCVELYEKFLGEYPTGDLIYKVRMIPGGRVINTFYVDSPGKVDKEIKAIEGFIKEKGYDLVAPIERPKNY